MPLSVYDMSIPVFTRALTNLAVILDRAEAHAGAQGVDPATVMGARLTADMHPFSSQVQFACNVALGAAARLADLPVPRFRRTDPTFADLRLHIAEALAFIAATPRDRVDGAEAREIVIPTPTTTLVFSGLDYLAGDVLPNVFFHITIAYALLRRDGLDLGKRDYLGADHARGKAFA